MVLPYFSTLCPGMKMLCPPSHLNLLRQIVTPLPWKYKIGAIIFNRKKVITIATNVPDKSHPVQFRYAEKAGEEKRIYLHAEINSIIKTNPKLLIGSSILVVRVGANGELRNSKPCPTCLLAIKESKIFNIFWTTGDTSCPLVQCCIKY